jgi:hypothetical protein
VCSHEAVMEEAHSSLIATIKTATEVEVRAIQDHKVIEWNTCWKCRLSEGTDDI